MVNHTPGPWEIAGRHVVAKSPVTLEDIHPYYVVADCMDEYMPRDQRAADARLIATAPDLLEALKAVVRVADRKTDEFDLARAAIAKAEGRS